MSEVAPSFQVLEGDLPDGKLGAVDAPGTLYDVTYEGAVLSLAVINTGQDGNGTTVVATLGTSLDGEEQRIALTSEIGDRALAAGDVLALKGGDTGHVKVTIQRDSAED